jgi:hypothetical protein
MANNDLQNITKKTKDWATRTPINTGDELGTSAKISSSRSTSVTRRVTIVTNSVISHEWGKEQNVNNLSVWYTKLLSKLVPYNQFTTMLPMYVQYKTNPLSDVPTPLSDWIGMTSSVFLLINKTK